jgi:intracellular septation protein
MTDLARHSTDTRPDEGSRVHPLIHAGRWLAADLLSTFVFVGLYALTHSVWIATGLAVGGGIAQIVYLKRLGRPIDLLQWLSLALVMLFGGASLVTQDPRFVMLKPTLAYCIVGAVMLRRGWLNRYLPPRVLEWSADVTILFGYLWAALMFGTAGLNLYLVTEASPAVWAWVLGVFPIASKFGLILVQYCVMRITTIGRMRAAGALPVRAGAARPEFSSAA